MLYKNLKIYADVIIKVANYVASKYCSAFDMSVVHSCLIMELRQYLHNNIKIVPKTTLEPIFFCQNYHDLIVLFYLILHPKDTCVN